jgi:hypothetical protein
MTLQSRIYARPPHLLTWATGPVDDDALRRHFEHVAAMPDLPPDGRELTDLRGANLRGVTAEGIRSLAERARGAAARPSRLRRVAILVDSDLAYGLGRMYEAYCLPGTVLVAVFRREDEARRWLFQDGDDAGPPGPQPAPPG